MERKKETQEQRAGHREAGGKGRGSVRRRLALLMATVAVAVLSVGGFGAWALRGASEGLRTIYEDKVVPTQDLRAIATTYSVSIGSTAQLLLSSSLPWAAGQEALDRAVAEIRARRESYFRAAHSESETRHVRELEIMFEVTDPVIEDLRGILARHDERRLKTFYVDELSPTIEPLLKKIGEVEALRAEEVRATYEHLYGHNRRTEAGILAAVALCLGGALALTLLTSRAVLRPLDRCRTQLGRIAEGDLTARAGEEGDVEFRQLSESINSMALSLSAMVDEIARSSRQIKTVVAELSKGSKRAAEAVHKQRASLERVSASATEVNGALAGIAVEASEAASISGSAMEMAVEGKAATDIAVVTVEGVQAAATGLAKVIEALNERSHEIGDIVTVINEITDQTDLLALNAAIEAARAGDSGRGFAVVADEVRKLAERTKAATAKITERVKAVREESSLAARAMQGAARAVTGSKEAIGTVSSGLVLTVSTIESLRHKAAGIDRAVEGQKAFSSGVAEALSSASNSAGEVVALSEEMTEEIRALESIGVSLQRAVRELRTTETEGLALSRISRATAGPTKIQAQLAKIRGEVFG